jgi:hypothetical protein
MVTSYQSHIFNNSWSSAVLLASRESLKMQSGSDISVLSSGEGEAVVLFQQKYNGHMGEVYQGIPH